MLAQVLKFTYCTSKAYDTDEVSLYVHTYLIHYTIYEILIKFYLLYFIMWLQE